MPSLYKEHYNVVTKKEDYNFNDRFVTTPTYRERWAKILTMPAA